MFSQTTFAKICQLTVNQTPDYKTIPIKELKYFKKHYNI